MTETKKNNELTSQGECGVSAEECYLKAQYRSKKVEDAWELGVILPGVKREDVTISCEDGILELKAGRHSTIPETWRPVRATAEPAGYRLRLELPADIALDRSSAKLENGVLSLRLPVAERARPQLIEVE